MSVEETAQTLITNAGFRDSEAIPTAVVKRMLIEALSGAIQPEHRVLQHLEDFRNFQTPPITLRRLLPGDPAEIERAVRSGVNS